MHYSDYTIICMEIAILFIITKMCAVFPGLLPFGDAANDSFGPTGDDSSTSH